MAIKLSQFIKRLEKALREYGDLPVYMSKNDDGNYCLVDMKGDYPKVSLESEGRASGVNGVEDFPKRIEIED